MFKGVGMFRSALGGTSWRAGIKPKVRNKKDDVGRPGKWGLIGKGVRGVGEREEKDEAGVRDQGEH